MDQRMKGFDKTQDKNIDRLRDSNRKKVSEVLPVTQQEKDRSVIAIISRHNEMSIRELKDHFNVVRSWAAENSSMLNDPQNELKQRESKVGWAYRLHEHMYNFSSNPDQKFRQAVKDYIECFDRKLDKEQEDFIDIRGVGNDKPLGVLSFDTIIKRKETPAKLQSEAEAKGLVALVTPETEDSYASLYVYDRNAVDAVLKKNAGIISDAGWPMNPDSFVQRVSQEMVSSKTLLFDVIADLFADHTNPLRKDMEGVATETQKSVEKYQPYTNLV